MAIPKRAAWAAKMWDALWTVHPHGLTPVELADAAGLGRRQILTAAKELRDTLSDEPDPPVVYVRKGSDATEGNRWYIAPSWAEHTRAALRSEYLQQSASRLLTAEKLLEQSKRAFPTKVRRINKVLRNVVYTREEIEDLLVGL